MKTDDEAVEDPQGHADEELPSNVGLVGPARNFTSPHVTAKNHQLAALPLAVIIFYAVSGGPYGVEESVRSAGALYTLLGFLIFPFVWTLPEAMMTAELCSAFPVAAGGVAWAEAAFGQRAGWMVGWLSYTSGATDNAIYPVLFLDYLVQVCSSNSELQDLSPIPRFLLLTSMVIFLAFLNWRGLVIVGDVTILVCLISMSPFVVFAIVGAFQIEPERWFRLPVEDTAESSATGGLFFNPTWGGVLWAPFLNNLFWNLNFFNSVATLAGDIRDPTRTIPRAFSWAFWAILLGYFIPLLVALGASDAPQSAWVDGYMATVLTDVVGSWIGPWVVLAAATSNIGLFEAELSTDAFQLMGMADRGELPGVFSIRSRYDTPTYAIMLGTFVIIVMGVANLTQLIEMLNFVYAFEVLLEYAAFLQLRIRRPELHRPVRVPFNTFGCVLLILPPIAAILVVIALSSYTTLLFGLGTTFLGLGLSFIFVRGDKEISVDGGGGTDQQGTDSVLFDPDKEISSSLLA